MSLSLAAAFTIFATAGFPVPPPASFQRTTAVREACPAGAYACVVWPAEGPDTPVIAMPKNADSAAAVHEVAHLVDAVFLTQRQRSKRLAPLLKRGVRPRIEQPATASNWMRFYAERYADSVARCLGYPPSYTHKPRLPKTTKRFCRALIPD